MSGQSIDSLAAAEPTTNTPEVAPSVAALHQGVPGSRSGSNTSARHQDVKIKVYIHASYSAFCSRSTCALVEAFNLCRTKSFQEHGRRSGGIIYPKKLCNISSHRSALSRVICATHYTGFPFDSASLQSCCAGVALSSRQELCRPVLTLVGRQALRSSSGGKLLVARVNTSTM